MSKYDISVNVKSTTTGGRQVSQVDMSRSSIRERMQQADALKTAITKTSSRDPNVKVNQQLFQVITKLDKNIIELNKSILGLDKTTRSMGGGRGGLTPPVGAGGGAGGLGSSIPIAGAAIAAFGYAMSKVMQVGQANIAKRMEQAGTVGVGGFQYSGKQLDIMSAADFGQYLKERRMQSGSFSSGEGEYGVGTDVTKAKQASFKHMALFGVSAGEMGRRVGVADVLSGGKGEEAINEIITRMYRKEGGKVVGPGTQQEFVLQAITDKMAEAVSEGVKDADLGNDIATEFTRYQKFAGGGYEKFAMQTMQTMMDVQKSISRGGMGGTSGFMMRETAMKMLRKPSSETRKRLMASGMFDEKTDFSKLSAAGRETAIQVLSSAPNAELMGEYSADLYKRFGKGKDVHAFRQSLQTLFPEMKLSAQQANLLFQRGREGKAVEPADWAQVSRVQDDNLRKNQYVQVGNPKVMQGQLEQLQLGPAGQEAAKTFMMVNKSMVEFAGSMSTTVAGGINEFNSAIGMGANAMQKFVGILESLLSGKKSTGDLLKETAKQYLPSLPAWMGG